MITKEDIKQISKIFCDAEDCDYCPFTEMCVPVWEISENWMNDGTLDTWKSGFQKALEKGLEVLNE